MAAGNAPDARLSPSHSGDKHRSAGHQVDVPGELSRVVAHNQSIAVVRIENVEVTRFDNEQINVRLARSKYDLAVGVGARRRQGLEDRNL